jgi:FkbM family methyltransferase
VRTPEGLAALRRRLARRMLRLSLLSAAATQHRGPVPDLGGTIDFEGTTGSLYLDASDRVLAPGLVAVGEWEPGETALLGAFLKPGMTVVDVGAHVGYYSVLAGRLVGPRGLVLAFEPDPRNFELLLANVWRNGLTNVVCFPWALSDRAGFAPLYRSVDNSGDHRLHAVAGEEREIVPVRTTLLDALEAIRPPVDLIKVDTQGGEEAVLCGAERLLAGSPDVLVTAEYTPAQLRAAGSDPCGILDYYRSLGFAVLVQEPEERGLLELRDEEIIARCGGPDGALHVNLVLTRDPSRLPRL